MMYKNVLAAALLASGLPLLGTAATAAPLSQSLSLQTGAAAPVETVQFRHRHGWGPGVAFGTGLGFGIYGGAPYAYDNYAYDNYAYAPGYADPGYAYVPAPVAPAPRFQSRSRNCSQGDEFASSYPAWACSSSDEHRW